MERKLILTGTPASRGRGVGTVVHFNSLDALPAADCNLVIVGEMIPPDVVTFAERVSRRNGCS